MHKALAASEVFVAAVLMLIDVAPCLAGEPLPPSPIIDLSGARWHDYVRLMTGGVVDPFADRFPSADWTVRRGAALAGIDVNATIAGWAAAFHAISNPDDGASVSMMIRPTSLAAPVLCSLSYTGPGGRADLLVLADGWREARFDIDLAQLGHYYAVVLSGPQGDIRPTQGASARAQMVPSIQAMAAYSIPVLNVRDSNGLGQDFGDDRAPWSLQSLYEMNIWWHPLYGNLNSFLGLTDASDLSGLDLEGRHVIGLVPVQGFMEGSIAYSGVPTYLPEVLLYTEALEYVFRTSCQP